MLLQTHLLVLMLIGIYITEVEAVSSPLRLTVASNVEFESVVASFSHTEALFWSTPCDTEVPVQLKECTGTEDGTELNPYCVYDEERTTVAVKKDSSPSVYFRGAIDNFSTCSSGFVVSLVPEFGVSEVTFTAGSFSKVLFDSDVVTAGVTPLSICCEELRTGAGEAWDGSFRIMAYFGGVTGKLTLLVPSDVERLPVSTYYSLVPPTLWCDGEEVACSGSTAGCPMNVLPTYDPIYSFWSSTIKNLIGDIPVVDLPVEGDGTVSTLVWISKTVPGYYVPSDSFGVGRDRVVDSELDLENCEIRYSGLVDEEGNPVTDLSHDDNRVDECVFEAYSKYYKVFQDIVDSLGSQELFSSSARTFAIIDLATTVCQSTLWQSCLNLARSFLVANENSEHTRSTTDCGVPEQDPTWETDPCCNIELQSHQCCRKKEIPDAYVTYTMKTDVDPLKDFPGCESPNCILQPLQNLVVSSSREVLSECPVDRLTAYTDPKFLENPFSECRLRVKPKACFYNNNCKDLGISAQCDPNSQLCVIPCETQEDCFNGVCDETLGRCLDLSDNKAVQDQALFDCVLAKVDPYLALLLVQEIENSDIQGTQVEKFIALVTEPKCTTAKGLPFANREYLTEQECAEFKGICKVQANSIGSPLLGVRTGNIPAILDEEMCDLTILNQEGYCGYDSVEEFGMLVISRPNVCEVRVDDANYQAAYFSEEICEAAFGGDAWLSIDSVGFRAYGSCVLMAASGSELDCYSSTACLGPQYKNVMCHSYCTDLALNNQAACEAAAPTPLFGFSHTWYFFPGSTVAGMCVIEVPTVERCWGEGLVWIAGRNWLPARFNTPETCPEEVCFAFFDYQGFLYDVPLDECIEYGCSSCYTGNEPQCESQEACESTLACNNPTGCIVPKSVSQVTGFDIPCIFSPEDNCIVLYNKIQCDANSFGWMDKTSYTQEEECKEALDICNDGTVPDGSFRRASSLGQGYSFRNKEECEACGGHIEEWWDWKESTWFSNNIIVRPKWQTENIVLGVWGPNLSPRKFEALLETVRVKRLTSILAAELYCNFGVESDILVYIGCSCGVHNSSEFCSDTLRRLTGSPISLVSVCEGIPVYKTIQDAVLEARDFSLSNNTMDSPCLDLKIDIIPFEQFAFKENGFTSSLALVSETDKSRLSSTFVYNKNGVVVGELIGDGYRVSFDQSREFSGVTICIERKNITDVPWNLRMERWYFDLATSSGSDDFEFVPLGLNIPLDTNSTLICADLLTTSKIYFPINLIEEWEDITIPGTWTSEELGLMIFCAVMFIILAMWVLWSLVMRISTQGLKKFPRSELCLLSLLILSTLGAAYQIGNIIGSYVSDTNLNPLFTDLPQLCLLTCVVITGATWQVLTFKAEHWGMKQKTSTKLAPFIFLLSLYFIFIGLMIAAEATKETREFTCATTEDEKSSYTTSEKIEISYKAIFAFYTSMIACAYLYAGISTIQVLKGSEFEDVLFKSSIATIIATVSLFITVAISLYSVDHVLPNTTKLAFTITVLILPGYALAYLFSYKSAFTLKIELSKLTGSTKSAKQATTTAGATSGGATSGGSVPSGGHDSVH